MQRECPHDQIPLLRLSSGRMCYCYACAEFWEPVRVSRTALALAVRKSNNKVTSLKRVIC